VTHASAEKGEAILERAVAYIAEFVESLHEDPLPEAERSGSLAP
jgi:creatinine amidohydrolase/Fe(II)-dependent formamide hydrolase-like protein